jgi:hypothetical protein
VEEEPAVEEVRHSPQERDERKEQNLESLVHLSVSLLQIGLISFHTLCAPLSLLLLLVSAESILLAWRSADDAERVSEISTASLTIALSWIFSAGDQRVSESDQGRDDTGFP